MQFVLDLPSAFARAVAKFALTIVLLMGEFALLFANLLTRGFAGVAGFILAFVLEVPLALDFDFFHEVVHFFFHFRPFGALRTLGAFGAFLAFGFTAASGQVVTGPDFGTAGSTARLQFSRRSDATTGDQPGDR